MFTILESGREGLPRPQKSDYVIIWTTPCVDMFNSQWTVVVIQFQKLTRSCTVEQWNKGSQEDGGGLSWIASSLADIVVQKWDEKVKQREYGPLDIEKTSNPKNINSNRIRTKIFGQIHLGVLLKLPHKEELRVGNSPVLRWDSFILILISRYFWRLYLGVIIFKFIFIPCPHPTRQHTWQLRRPGTKL